MANYSMSISVYCTNYARKKLNNIHAIFCVQVNLIISLCLESIKIDCIISETML